MALTPISNVYDKRAVGASERWLFYDLTTTILNCITTTLGANYNYMRNN
jgi:hypothetical protein